MSNNLMQSYFLIHDNYIKFVYKVRLYFSQARLHEVNLIIYDKIIRITIK